MHALFRFPDPVDETSARVVATGVVLQTTAVLALRRPALMLPLVYGFAARVLTGPTLSPLGQLATRVVSPRLPGAHRAVPGAPKRLAQGTGLVFSTTALVLHRVGRPRAAYGVLSALLAAASLEAFAGVCVACKAYPLLVRAGLAPVESCPDCADPWRRQPSEGSSSAA